MNSLNLQNLQFTTLAKTKGQLISVNPPYKKSISIVVKKIVAVYQLQYTNGPVYGLGDFIRGCFYLIHVCKKLGVIFDINFSNHPLSTYLEGHDSKMPTINYNNISKMEIPTNYETPPSPLSIYTKVTDLLRNVKSDVYYTSSSLYPIFKINQTDIDFIKSKLIPNVEMKKDIKQEMTNLNLIHRNFSVIHIRLGDEYLFNNNVLDQCVVDKIFNTLMVLLNNKSRKYLILSDSTELKLLFKSYDNCVFQNKQITHLGENLVLDQESVRNTMIDWYLMSRANHIYSYSMIAHGSGFSMWCAVVYNIPIIILD